MIFYTYFGGHPIIKKIVIPDEFFNAESNAINCLPLSPPNFLVLANKIGKMMVIRVEQSVHGFFCIPWAPGGFSIIEKLRT